MRRSDIEIMAPVGCYESLRAAIAAGADSVYFGVGVLNMRAKSAANFGFEDLDKIVRIELNHVIKRIEEYGCRVSISERAYGFLAAKAYNPEYGARPLKRAIQRYFEDELSEEILRGNIVKGVNIYVDADIDGDKLKIEYIEEI